MQPAAMTSCSSAAGRAARRWRHRLVPRRAEEAAGVDDDHPRVFRAVRGGHPARAQQMIHPVGIDAILGTAEGQDVKGAIGVACRGFNHDGGSWTVLTMALALAFSD